MTLARIAVASVRIGERHRQNLGDLDGLSKSMSTLGLLHPIGVTPDDELVFGRRRLEAARLLGWEEIDARIIDVDRLLAERDENLARKDFTPSERVAIAAAIMERIGERRGRPRKVEEVPQYPAEIPTGEKTREHAAREAGFGNDATFRQARAVVDKAVPGLRAAMDAGAVSISAAAKLAKRPLEEQAAIVHAVASGEAKDYRAAERIVSREKRVQSLGENIGIPEGQYRVIYADPPWAYKNSGLDQSAASHYDPVPPEEIASRWAADVERVSTPESVLFCWATSPLLPEAIDVMRAWGFSYVTSFVWVKDRPPAIGWWAKTRHELLLVGRKRDALHPAIELDTIVEAAVREHSRKPEEFYDLIEAMYPVSTRRPVHLELFSRRDREGWVRGLYNQELVA